MSEGRKDDGGKLRYDLLSPEALRGIADVLRYGAAKYEDRNWEAGIKWSRVYAALLRHLVDAWWAGEDFDEESGLHHLDHAACCLHFLQTYRHTRTDFDDRPASALIREEWKFLYLEGVIDCPKGYKEWLQKALDKIDNNVGGKYD